MMTEIVLLVLPILWIGFSGYGSKELHPDPTIGVVHVKQSFMAHPSPLMPRWDRVGWDHHYLIRDTWGLGPEGRYSFTAYIEKNMKVIIVVSQKTKKPLEIRILFKDISMLYIPQINANINDVNIQGQRTNTDINVWINIYLKKITT